MKRLLLFGVVIAMIGAAVVLGDNAKTPKGGSDAAARATAVKLFATLTDEQKALAVKEFGDKERKVEQFPGVERPGLPFGKLTAEQKALVEELISGMTSAYGAERCLAVLKQTGKDRQYVNFFGEPSADKPFAYRVAAHHLTLVHAEFGKGDAGEFGPVLLGGNPVNQLWDAEEKIALDLYAGLSDAEQKSVKGKGVKVADLGEKGRALAKALYQKRIEVFSDDRRKVLEAVVAKHGGVDKLTLTFSGNPAKSHHDGGAPNWKLTGDKLLFDWQTAGKNHIHMTVRANTK